MPFQRVHRTVGCQVRDQELPRHQSRRCNVECVKNVRQHWPVHARGSWLTIREHLCPNLPCRPTPLGSCSPSSSLSGLYVSTCISCSWAYGSSVAMQGFEVELTSLVTPYASNMGISILAWRRPRELSGRAESFPDQSLRSIAFMPHDDQRSGGRLSKVLLHQEMIMRVA